MLPITNKSLAFGFLLIALVLVSNVAAQPPPPKFSNERFVMNAMFQIAAAEATYFATAGNNSSYGTLTQLHTAGFIDTALASGRKYGYVFDVAPLASGFIATAIPAVYRKGGLRSFYIDSHGSLRGSDKNGQPATSDDPIIDGCALWGIADNERCAIRELRTITSAESVYAATGGNGQFGTLSQLFQAALIDSVLAKGVAHHYNFSVVVNGNGFQAVAIPAQYATTGFRSYFVDQSGVVRGADHQGQPATIDDPPI